MGKQAVSRADSALEESNLCFEGIIELWDAEKEASARTGCWSITRSELRGYSKGQAMYSRIFTWGKLKDCYVEFYPKGDSSADSGQCSLFLFLTRGVEVEVDILLNGALARTLKH